MLYFKNFSVYNEKCLHVTEAMYSLEKSFDKLVKNSKHEQFIVAENTRNRFQNKIFNYLRLYAYISVLKEIDFNLKIYVISH